MGPSRKLLIDGESVITSMRTHVKVLLLPFVLLVVLAGVTGFLAAAAGDRRDGWVRIGVLAAGLLLILWASIVPFFRWLAWTYTITDKRLIEQRGILTRSGRVIPLSRINDVSFEKNLNDRLLGCGTLIIHDASEQTGLELDDVPQIQSVHRTLSQLVLDAHRHTHDESI